MKKFLDYLKEKFGEKLLALLLAQVLTPENIKEALMSLLNYAEEMAQKTETKIDDNAILALKKALGLND